MAASASGHLAGQVAAVSQLLPVRAQRPSARQSPARRPAGGDCRMTRFTPPKPDKSLHFLREAARPVFEADRHAKKTLKKPIRGVRRIERAVEDVIDPQNEVVRGYCAAVRSAITDDGHSPLAASGLKLKGRLEAVADSLDRVAEKGGSTAA